MEAYIKELLKQANKSVYQRNLTGSPLNIIMIASAFEENLETYLERGEISLPGKLDILYLYETFAERKIHTDETEKKMEDFTNASLPDDHEMLKEIQEKLEKCSLLVTLPSELNPLRVEEIQTKIQPFVEKLQTGKDKICTAMKVKEKRPHFMHRSIAEYFTARWFSKNIESNRSILEHILFDCSYAIVRNIFDRILARDSPLHCAVLEEDAKKVITLIREECNVSALDKGGRTVMHLIAIHHSKCWDVINDNCNYEVSLDTRDCVLQWTPLQYAIKSQNWFMVERLLERNVDRSGLDMIRQRAQDQHCINTVIMHAEKYGHLSLLEFLRTIGM